MKRLLDNPADYRRRLFAAAEQGDLIAAEQLKWDTAALRSAAPAGGRA